MKTRETLTALLAVGLLVGLACPAQAGLVAYYSFDADNADDLSGNANHGTVGGSMLFETDTPAVLGGKSLRSQSGGGSGNVVTVPTSASLESINHTLSVAFWMKSNLGDNNTWVRIFQHGTEANPSRTWMINRYGGDNEVNVRVDTTAGGQHNQNIARGGPAPFDGTWHHVVFTVDSGAWTKYEDAAPVGSGGYNHGDGLTNTPPLYIFGRNGTGEYVGSLDEVTVYDHKLAANQVSHLAGGGDPTYLPPVIPKPFQVRQIRIADGTGLDGDINNTTEALSIHDNATGTGPLTIGTTNYNVDVFVNTDADVIDYAGGGGNFPVNNGYPGPAGDDFLVRAQTYVKIPAGTWTVAFGSDDGGAVRLDGINFAARFGTNGAQPLPNESRYEGTRGHGWTGGSFTVGATTASEVFALFFERGGGDSFELAVAQGAQGGFGGSFQLLENGVLGWRISDTAAGLFRQEIAGDGYAAREEMAGTQQNEAGDPMTGARVVRIIQNKPTGPNPLQLGEVEAIETSTLTNVARDINGGSATQSSDYGGGTYPAGLAIDGNTGNFQHTNDGQGEWWQVAFDAQKDLDKLTIYSRVGCCNEGRTADIQVQVYGDLALSNLLFDERVLGIGTSDVRDVPMLVLQSADLVVTLDSDVTYAFEIQDGATADQLGVPNPDPSIFTTVLDLNGATLEVELLLGADIEAGDTWLLLDADRIEGSFGQIILPDVSYLGVDYFLDTGRLGIDGTLALRVPEPATLALLGLAVAGLGGYVRRRRRA